MFTMDQCAACLDVEADGTVGAPSARGVVAVTKPATGVYSIKISTDLPTGVGQPILVSRDAAFAVSTAQKGLDTWEVYTYDATGVAADAAFSFAVFKRPGLPGES